MTLFRNRVARRSSVAWAESGRRLHFMVQSRTTSVPRDDDTKAPAQHAKVCKARQGGRAPRGGPPGVDSARGAG